MNKKFLSAVLFGALMVSSTGTFVSCKDYDEDIDRIDKELVDIKSALSALQAKVDAGKYVTNVVKNGDGITVTWVTILQVPLKLSKVTRVKTVRMVQL